MTDPRTDDKLSPGRRLLVEKARDLWVRRLIDVSRRNSLLYYRPLKMGTLDLGQAEPRMLDGLLNGQSIALGRLVPRDALVHATAQARSIRRRALTNLEEKGIETLFLALGSATWAPSDHGRAPAAPVLLLPIAIESRAAESEIKLRRAGDPQPNLALLHVLTQEHGCEIDPAWLIEDVDEPDEALDPTMVYSRLLEVTRSLKDFAIAPAAVLGNFSFQKLAMVKDLREQGMALIAHDIIAALAGDADAHTAIRAARRPLEPGNLDSIAPEHEFLVLDADSSQQAVIAAVLEGQTGVIQGPPGTGKSQTIANLIAALAAQGKRVLFVAEKRAALDVVLRRLQNVGLGHLALDLHGTDISRRELAGRFATSLAAVRDAPPIDASDLHRSFVERRRRLNDHVARLHSPRPPANLSVYALEGRLLRFPPALEATTRWRGEQLHRMTTSNAEAVRDLLVEAGGFDDLFLGSDPSPWAQVALLDGVAVQAALDLVARIAQLRLTRLRAASAQAAQLLGLPAPQGLKELWALRALLSELIITLNRYKPAVFQLDLDQLARKLAAAGEGTLRAAWAWVSDTTHRAAVREVAALRLAGADWNWKLVPEILAAAQQQQRWQALAHGQASAVPDLDTLRRAYSVLADDADDATAREDVQALGRLLGCEQLEFEPFTELAQRCANLLADPATPQRLPRLRAIERELNERDAASFVAELRATRPPVDSWIARFDHAWLSSCLDEARAGEPQLTGFNGTAHARFVTEFADLDQQRIAVAAARVRRAHAERVIAAMNAQPAQEAVVRREVEKKTRHLPLRRLLPQAAEVLTTLCPCWMASPLSVSQLIPTDQRYFDVVIFDEASQVLPEDAIAALLRASAVVVAGDQRQLPPTTFFAAGENEDEDDAAAQGFESLLDLMAAFLEPWPLQWHYRSRDEALIAFANHYIYADRLVTFPSTHSAGALRQILVQQLWEQDGQEESAHAEVQRVVELVLEHARTRPDETLGVITLGLRHADRVQLALDEAWRARPELEAFFDPQREERFFVKNLERVQGDERDAIILSVGYGKDHTGRLPHRFGPLLSAGGERRLNVAITRARRRMTVVSSFDHSDMDPARSTARGVELLRLYLQYAASGGRLLGDAGHAAAPLAPFEAAIFDVLTARGMTLLPQWGASQYRIDMVAQHPQQPGRLVLAIECDGASYKASPTARDRDRLRQQHLEALGWHFHRIWSQDWYARREAEIARAMAAFEAALHAVDAAEKHDNVLAETQASAEADLPAAKKALTATARATRPLVWPGQAITDYAQSELLALLRWINSDGRLRSDDELLAEMVRELGFKRRGVRIEALIREVIALERGT